MLSAIGVYIKNASQIITLVVNLARFLSPVFYTTAHLTGYIRQFILFNPLTEIIESLRRCLFADAPLDWIGWSYSFGASMTIFMLGAIIFVILRNGFSDVL